MKKKEYLMIVLTAVTLLINLLGRSLAVKLVLPIWCDSIGTFLMAYIAGPVCGAIVGFANNIIYGIYVDQQSVYCIVGALLGMIVGYFAKKKVFDTQFTTMTFGMALAIFSTFTSVIINTMLYEGSCGNVWGNQVMLLAIENGFPKYFSFVLGQFCLEFLDKLLCAEIVYLIIKCVRHIRKLRNKRLNSAGMLFFAIAVMSIAYSNERAMANEENNYDSYIQLEYSNNEGLLSGEANDIAQTKDGKLWIGTYAGLFTYDGSKFRHIGDVDSVKNVNCLFVDEEGRLWVGTNDDGVTIFINEHVMNVIDEENGVLSNTVKSITCDSEGSYYIGTAEGISVVSLNSGVKITKTYEQFKNVTKMSSDRKGNVVIVTEKGELFWFVNGENVNPPMELPEEYFYSSVFFTEDNRLLIGANDNCILSYDMSNNIPRLDKTIEMKNINTIKSFYATEDGEVFICADNGVAVMQSDYSYKKLNTNAFASSIDNMLVDYQGNLWFTSSRLGLLELCKSPFLEIFPLIGKDSVVNSTEKWNDLLFCGTDDGLIIVDEDNIREVKNDITELLKNVRVRCLKVDSRNNLWIATTGSGIYKVSGNQNHGYNIRNYTEDDGMPDMRYKNILELKDGTIAAAGNGGVAILENDMVKHTYTSQNGLTNEKTLCMLEYKDSVYIGSDGGGITVVSNNQIVEYIGKSDGLSSGVILRMIYDPVSDGMFIVTSNGLCYMSPERKISTLRNFPYSNNFDIICEENGISWILSSAGVYVADTDDLISDVRKDYVLINSKRGFNSSITANSWICRDGEDVYLCCDNGVVKVNLKRYDVSVKSYRMVLNHIYVDGERYEINRVDTLKLSSQAETIVFEPEILNYSINDPYVSIYLEGYDSKEKVCLLSELNSFTYANLSPGKYTFHISILDNAEGNVLEAGSYNIVKEIEMYQKWWFKLYVIVIAGLVLIWITWFLTRTQVQKTLIKQKYQLEYARKQIKMGNETILSIARAVDAKDSNTSEHSFRVSEYSVAIARKLGYSDDKLENLRQMALLHDIGKIGVPDAILNKPGKLTDEEYEIMKSHVIKGGEILKDFTMINNVNVGAMYHHEKYDGTGYCKGLKGEDIPLDARIIGIADAFDAMTANRVYRKKLDINKVIDELKRCSGTQFDPKLVEILLSLIDDKVIDVEILYKKSKEEI